MTGSDTVVSYKCRIPKVAPWEPHKYSISINLIPGSLCIDKMVQVPDPDGSLVDISSGFVAYDDHFCKIRGESPSLEILLEYAQVLLSNLQNMLIVDSKE